MAALAQMASAQDKSDQVVFGSPASEAAAHLTPQNSTTGTDASGLSFRRMDKGGRLTFDLPCDPTGQNYLTVRMSGSEKNSGYLFVVQGDGGRDLLNPPKPELAQGELDGDSANPPFLGRYYYDTYLLPTALTQGKTRVRLSIESRGAWGFYGDNSQHEQTEPSKAVYLAAVRNQPFYSEPGEEKLGQRPPAGVPPASPDGLSAYDHLHGETVKALDLLLSWQFYGASFQKARAFSPNFSPMLEGAIVSEQDVRTATTDGRFRGREGWTEEQWLASFTKPAINEQNWCPMFGVEALGNAYVYPWSGRYYHGAETLDRMFKALDFWCRAQDRTGAFAVIEDEGHPRRWQWIGAQTDHSGARGEGYNWDLQANGVPSLAKGFLTVYNDVTSRHDPAEKRRLAAYLDEKVDNDNTGRKEVTRRQALAQLYARSRDFFATKGGRDYYDPAIRNPTPSQGFNVECLYVLNRALQRLQESAAVGAADTALDARFRPWPTSQPTDRLPAMIFDRLGEMADGDKWFSETGGLSLEGGASGGGFDGNYGVGMQGGMDNLARVTEGDTLVHGRIVEKLNALLDGYSHFYRRDLLDGHPVLAVETITVARNIFNHVRPSYGIQPYAALQLNHPAALRRAQLYVQDGQPFSAKADPGFFYYNLLELQQLCNCYAALEQKLAAQKRPLRLPMEDGAPDFVWSDMDAQAVVLKNGPDRMWLAFNWRRPHWEANDVTRIHLLEPMVRRVANVRGSHLGEVLVIPASAHDPVGLAPNGRYYDHRAFDILNQVRFGKYLISQNVSKTRTFPLNAPGVRRARDLATGKVFTAFPISVKPRTAVVLEVLD